jgi:hypothetical protein
MIPGMVAAGRICCSARLGVRRRDARRLQRLRWLDPERPCQVQEFAHRARYIPHRAAAIEFADVRCHVCLIRSGPFEGCVASPQHHAFLRQFACSNPGSCVNV